MRVSDKGGRNTLRLKSCFVLPCFPMKRPNPILDFFVLPGSSMKASPQEQISDALDDDYYIFDCPG